MYGCLPTSIIHVLVHVHTVDLHVLLIYEYIDLQIDQNGDGMCYR